LTTRVRLAGLLLASVLFAAPLFAEDPRPEEKEEKPETKPPTPIFSLKVVLSDFEPTRERSARTADLFYAAASAELHEKGWGARVELRGRDGRFRPYFRGDLWLQDGFAWVATPAGNLGAGKLERFFGLSDTTFAGTLFSMNGVTRNPDWGARLAGEKRFGYDTLGWIVQWFGQNDHVAWEEDGRGVESDPAATLRDDVEARVSWEWNGGPWTVKPGVSFASGRIARSDAVPDFRRTDAALDVTGTLGPLALRFEGFTRSGSSFAEGSPVSRLGYLSAVAWMAALNLEFPTVTYRYTYSAWSYKGGADVSETLHQPALVWTPVRFVEAVIEYDARRLRSPSETRTYNAFWLGLSLSLP
jgi:hypothetical protein